MLLPNAYAEPQTSHIMTVLGDKVFKEVINLKFGHQLRLQFSDLCLFAAATAASVVSDSVRPQRRQPTRLRHPWDSPDKTTGVGCHFLLQCMKVKVKLLSCVRFLATPWTAAYQAPPSMRFARQEYWSVLPLPFPVSF